MITAYNQHRALVIRLDDVWIAILCQFNFFVNANEKLLRMSFVAHEGRKELVIEELGTRHSVDFADISRQMSGRIEENVVAPAVPEWEIPGFTRTTGNDRTVGAAQPSAKIPMTEPCES